MRKLTFLLALSLVACKPSLHIDYAIDNQSGHAVTLQPHESARLNASNCDTYPTVWTFNDKSNTVFFSIDDAGKANYENAALWMNRLLGDSATFIFDDGKKLVFSRDLEEGIFDFREGHMSAKIDKEWDWTLHSDQSGKFTFKLTSIDYNNAR